MKHPKKVTVGRHELSTYNKLKKIKSKSKTYQRFLKAFNKNCRSALTKKLALAVNKEFQKYLVPDALCGLVDKKHTQTKKMALFLKKDGLPDVVYVSPYLRTMETYKTMVACWPELADVRMVSEPRIRERSYGKVANFVDWRVYFTLHPEQKDIFDSMGETASYRYRYPGGESIFDVKQRVGSFFNSLKREYPNKKILLVTHTLIVMVLRQVLEELTVEEFMEIEKNDKPTNNGITIYLKKPRQHRLELLSYNNTNF